MRRVIAVLVLLAGAPVALAQATFHGGVARTGVYPAPGPAGSAVVKWAFETGGPIVGSPAIAQGVVYIGSDDGNFYAVDQTSGLLKWKFATKGRIASSPAVAEGLVYFGSYDGGFYAIDAATGALKWRFAMQYEKRFEAKGIHGYEPRQQTIPDAWDFFSSSPVVSHGCVYFGSGDGNVYAVDAKVGALRWQFSTNGVVHSSPAIAGDTLYVGSFDTYLYALDADSGRERWRFKTGEDPENHNQVGITSSAAIADGIVYFGCRDAHVYAVDASTGKLRWSHYTDQGWVSATPAIRDGVLYIGTGSNKEFLAIDARTGAVRFAVPIQAGIFSSVALAGDRAYVGNTNGRLVAYDIVSGKLAWEFRTEAARADVRHLFKADGSWNPATLGKSDFGDFQNMYLTMEKRFSVGAILSSPVVDRGEIYFGSTDGRLYALR